MPIIKCPAIEKPMRQFSCDVLRTASKMHYQEITCEWKPVQPERWENWTVLAETKVGQGKLPCDCGGQLNYTVAAINGHIWAKCKDCGIYFNE